MIPPGAARRARELGEALAFIIGDERDEPLRCASCQSTDLERDYARDILRCGACGMMTTTHIAAELRTERLRARVESGVGGPLVRHYRPSRPSHG